MEEIVEEVIYLSGFSPLIQIWAGICLLFFYEGLLRVFPLEQYWLQTKSLYDEFSSKYQAYIDQKKITAIEDLKGSKWEVSFLPTIKNIASLGFFFSVFLLAYIGMEKTSFSAERYGALQVIDFAVVVYMVLSVIGNGWRIFHTYWTSVAYISLLIIVYHLYPFVNDWLVSKSYCIGPVFSVTHITVLTLFTCFSPVPLVLSHLIYDFFVYKLRSRNLKRINTNYDLMTDILMGIKKPNELPEHLKKKISRKVAKAAMANGEVTQTDFNNYIAEEIEEEFILFTTKWYQRIGYKLVQIWKNQIISKISLLYCSPH